MKKKITLLASMLCTLCAFADDGAPGITVNKSDGSSISIVISELKSIKFGEGTMIVNMKDDSQQNISIGDIKNITFEDIATAINTLTKGNAADSAVCITDLSGRTVYSGKAAGCPVQGQLPSGIYVITANGKSCKVMIK